MDFLSQLNAVRVLVAVIDPDEMDLISVMLEEAGYSVQKAYYPGDAFYALEERDISVALVDVWMADRERNLLVDRMGDYTHIPWVALIDDRYEHPKLLLRQGAAAYLRRPVESRHLLRHLENALNGQSMATDPQPLDPALVDDPVLASALSAWRDAADGGDADLSQMLQQRLIEQQTLSALARSLSSVLDVDELLTQIVDAAVRLCTAEEGLLLLPDEEGKALWVRAVKGLDSETARNFRIKTQDSLAGQVFRSGQALLIGDQGPQKVKTEYLVKSLLYVPLILKGETIGVLGVNNKTTPRTFTAHDQELLQHLAAHAAIAIENARLYEERVLRTRELSTLVQASEAANSTLEIDSVLAIIAEQLLEALNVTQYYVGEWRPGETRLNTLAVNYRAVWDPLNAPVVPGYHHRAIEQAFGQKRMVILELPRVSSQALEAALLPQRFQARHAVHVPLLLHSTPLGLATLYRMHAPYTERSAPTGRYAQLQQIALEIIVALSGQQIDKQNATLFAGAQRMIEIANADWCEVALWDADERRFNILLSVGEAVWVEDDQPGLNLDEFPSLRRLLETQQPVVAGTTGTQAGTQSSTHSGAAPELDSVALTAEGADDLAALCTLGQSKSMLGLPLLIRGETAGVVLLSDTLHQRQFSRREVELAEALLAQAAGALHNARLYGDLQRSLDELHRTQSKLVQTARLSAMGELAAAVAHQINNPLTTILGDTELLLQDVPPTDANAEALQAISRAGKRAHEVVRRLLTMARQQRPDDLVVALDVNETIQNTLTLVKSHIQQGRVALDVALAASLPPVAAVQGQLEDVWLNLLLNARDAVTSHENATIGITSQLTADSQGVEVRIWDNGMGIAPEFIDQIFEPFFTTKATGEGTGLGLHICRQVIHKCGGSIHVQSTYNQGTEFVIQLPLYQRHNQS